MKHSKPRRTYSQNKENKVDILHSHILNAKNRYYGNPKCLQNSSQKPHQYMNFMGISGKKNENVASLVGKKIDLSSPYHKTSNLASIEKYIEIQDQVHTDVEKQRQISNFDLLKKYVRKLDEEEINFVERFDTFDQPDTFTVSTIQAEKVKKSMKKVFKGRPEINNWVRKKKIYIASVLSEGKGITKKQEKKRHSTVQHIQRPETSKVRKSCILGQNIMFSKNGKVRPQKF